MNTRNYLARRTIRTQLIAVTIIAMAIAAISPSLAHVVKRDAITGQIVRLSAFLSRPWRTRIAGRSVTPFPAATYVVTTTADNLDNNSPTPGSLRAAIHDANLSSGADTIEFNIPGAGPHTINVGAGLPVITDTLTIDGYSQPGSSQNTLADGNDAVLKIEIQGNAPLQGTGLVIGASDCVVQGIVIHGFNHAIMIDGSRTNAGASRNVVRGNFVGTNITGTAGGGDYSSVAGNFNGGIFIDSGSFKPDGSTGTADDNVIGGVTPAARNVISGNGSFGVRITQSFGSATGNLVQGNFIGTNAAGAAAIGGGTGIFLNAPGNTIGGAVAGARNVISGNNYSSFSSHGITICCGAKNNLVQGNFIGTDVTGTLGLPNVLNGVDINGAGTSDNIVGGASLAARNIISGNGVMGVSIGNTSGNKVQGNFIGTDVTGALALGNTFNGVLVSGASSAFIGGILPGEGNVIAANARGGIDISADNVLVQGNFIGTTADGASPLGNAQYGMRVAGANNFVGGRTSGAGNLIAFSRLAFPFSDIATGVIVSGSNTNTTISGNAIHSNEGLGIDLGRDGMTPNDICDADLNSGSSNQLQNYPVLTSAASGGGTTTITGTFDSAPGTTFTLDFYANAACDVSGYGEGQTYLGSATVTTDANCGSSFTATLPATVPAGQAVTATATDPGGNTSEFSACVAVTLSNSPPDAVDDNLSTDEDTAVVISPLANDADSDNDTITISSFTQGASGSVTHNGGGTLTYTPNANFNGNDSFTYSISDGNGGSDSATITILVNAVADPPDAVNDTAITNEDAAVTVSVLANDANGDCGGLIVTAITQPAHGSASINANGTVTYTPQANFHGADSFRYTIGCGQSSASANFFKSSPVSALLKTLQPNAAEDSDEAEVSVSVTPVNDPPDAVDDAVTTQQDTPITLDVLANDTDVEGDAFIVNSYTQGTHGSVNINPDGTLTYTSNAGFSGTDSFTYTIGDGNGGTDTATVTITITAVSLPPDAVDDEATTDEDTTVTIDPRANDSDGSCGAVTISDYTQGTHGSVLLFNGSVFYSPAANFNGTDSFTYTLRCTGGDTDTATVSVTVNPINDAPRAVNDSYATDEDVVLNVAAPGVLANDTDADGDPLSVTLVSGPTRGTLALNADGTFSYTPPLNFSGTTAFTYEVSDGNGGTSRAVVTINIPPVNDPPVARDDVATTQEENLVSLNVLTNDSDLEGEALTLIGFTPAANGRTSIFPILGVAHYLPNRDFFGEDSFTYTVGDASGNTSTATVRVTVTPVNDAPVAVEDNYELSGASLTIAEPGILANDSDVEGDTLRVKLLTAPTTGTLTLNPDGSFTYTPGPNFAGCDSFDYYVFDGHQPIDNAFSNSATVSITGSAASAASVNGPFAVDETSSSAFSSSRLKSSDRGVRSHHATQSTPTATPSWSGTGSLNTARAFHTVTLLKDGKVLAVGGTSNAVQNFFTGRAFLKTTELYDPATQTWRRTGDLRTARGHHTAALLPDGKVLIAGGVGTNGVLLKTAEVYDPATGTWTPTGNLNVARAGHTATVLPQSPSTPGAKVLIAAGVGNGLSVLNSAEIYDSATGMWTRTRNLTAGRWAHSATFLPNGKILVAGGYGTGGSFILNTAELYDPATNTWTRTAGKLNAARGHHTATLLQNGRKVLFAGGIGSRGVLNVAELYDPLTDSFTPTQGRLNTGRWLHTATLLRDGRVLAAGGNGDGSFGLFVTNTSELYDPATDTWARTGKLNVGRHSQTATLLYDNQILATGGMRVGVTLKTAELYDPLDSRRLFSSCTALIVTAVHGEGFNGNSRIAKIENGRVPCVHAETGEVSECLFDTSDVSASLMWVEAVDGQYAKTGQAITPQGEPGGDWIVAARVNTDGTVPCVAPSGHDTMGHVSDGTELANTCVVELIGVEWNSYPAEWGWTPLLNYATLEVCSLNNPFSHPHPDNARLTRTVSTCRGVLGCYTEGGAALNDINGTERDWVGDYFTGTSACHSIQVGGYEVPAAKRPATRSFPVPGVNTNSFIVWRPVNPNVTIANGSR